MSCITGDDTGLVKVWDVRRSSGAVLKTSFGTQKRSQGISAMCWLDKSMTSLILSRADGLISLYDNTNSMLLKSKYIGFSPAVASGMAVVQGRLVIVNKQGLIAAPAMIDLFEAECRIIKKREEEALVNCEDYEDELTPKKVVKEASSKKKTVLIRKKKQNNNQQAQKAPEAQTEESSDIDSDDSAGESEGQDDEEKNMLECAPVPFFLPEQVKERDEVTCKNITNRYGIVRKQDIDKHFVQATHIHRRLALVGIGGKDNNLGVYSIAPNCERPEVPLFRAQNVEDHVLGITQPVHIVGISIVDSHTYAVTSADRHTRFYDRRISTRPVQQFSIGRELENRCPTCMLQWNCNKFVIGDTTGDVHLYDVRRGFASRAKLRGGVGSVRQMVKNPGGHKTLTVIGLDRKCRIYYLPTGELKESIYLKQMGTSVLMDSGMPFADSMLKIDGVSGVVNSRSRLTTKKQETLPAGVWDDMLPCVDDDYFEMSPPSSCASDTLKNITSAENPITSAVTETQKNVSGNDQSSSKNKIVIKRRRE